MEEFDECPSLEDVVEQQGERLHVLRSQLADAEDRVGRLEATVFRLQQTVEGQARMLRFLEREAGAQSNRSNPRLHDEARARVKEAVLKHLTPDLLRPGQGGGHPLAGYAYVATLVARQILLQKGEQDWVMKNARDSDGCVHWWLEQEGLILDVTEDYYLSRGRIPPYTEGRVYGPPATLPKNARRLRDRVKLPVNRSRPSGLTWDPSLGA